MSGRGAAGREERVYLDSTVLSTLALTGSVGPVVGTLANPRTSYEVRRLVRAGRDAGADHLEDALAHLYDPLHREVANGDRSASDREGRQTERERPDPSVTVAGSLARQRKPELFDRLSTDEASVLYQSWAAAAPLATDDRDVRAVAASYGVPVTGSLGLLVRAVEADAVTVDVADGWLSTWADAGVCVPVDSVESLLAD